MTELVSDEVKVFVQPHPDTTENCASSSFGSTRSEAWFDPHMRMWFRKDNQGHWEQVKICAHCKTPLTGSTVSVPVSRIGAMHFHTECAPRQENGHRNGVTNPVADDVKAFIQPHSFPREEIEHEAFMIFSGREELRRRGVPIQEFLDQDKRDWELAEIALAVRSTKENGTNQRDNP